jgi:hypothetical protein
MTTLLRSWHRFVLPALLLLAGTASAQSIEVRPLAADPGRALSAPRSSGLNQQRTAALALPFFDDFTSPLEGAPRSDRWVPGGGTLVSNRFAINPPTRGAVTFDGLKANGQSYSNSTANVFTAIDSLTSQTIDLSGSVIGDSVILSFALQTGSIVGPPTPSSSSTPVNLELQFRRSTGQWTTAPGWPRRTLAAQTTTTPFRQVWVVLNQAQYFYGTFQFRFIATGNSSYAGDTWSIDYVRLDRGRGRPAPSSPPDTAATDVATSAGLDTLRHAGMSSPLRRYTAMPVWQFNAASPATSELNTRLGVKVQNLSADLLPLPILFEGTVRELRTNTALGTWTSGNSNITTTPRLNQLVGDASQLAIPTTPEAKLLRYTLALTTRETDLRVLSNDTIFRDVELANYYAYDDGTSEAIVNLPAVSTGLPRYFAYKFEANQPDQVQAIRLYPVFTPADLLSRSVTINVWDDNNGQPATAARISKSVSIPNPLPNGATYIDLSFDTPVSVTGTFYVGFGQASLGRLLHYGYDLNSLAPAGYFWSFNNGAWTPVSTTPQGTIMMRPVLNNNVITATAPARDAAAFALYPNPSSGSVTVEGPAFVRATVLDALGRTAWEQPASQQGQRQLALNGLPAGVYIVRLALADGSTATCRLVINQ